MTWKFVAGDKYTYDDLLEIREFFLNDLESALKEYAKYEKWTKFGLPNFRTDQLRRQMGIEEANKNLVIVDQALREWKE